mmetsp:Transcript_20362/g.28345  ORF Transcript_20362/g.28345 Transcript_20362/m.28345 type:complete len:135 (+) Transcript_20362:213-617(+)
MCERDMSLEISSNSGSPQIPLPPPPPPPPANGKISTDAPSFPPKIAVFVDNTTDQTFPDAKPEYIPKEDISATSSNEKQWSAKSKFGVAVFICVVVGLIVSRISRRRRIQKLEEHAEQVEMSEFTIDENTRSVI